MAALLTMLGVGSEAESVVSITEDGRLAFDADTVFEIYDVLTGFLPLCWTARVYYGYEPPEGCTMPESLCAACVDQARRVPAGHQLSERSRQAGQEGPLTTPS